MKTALLLTNAAATQRLLTDILGEKTNFVLLPPPADPTREKFDALFTTWLRLVDAVILDAASLGETSRWAVESLAEARLQEHQAVVVRATAAQQSLYPMPTGWLIVADTDSPEQLKQSLGTFFELRDAQAKLKRADAILAQHRQAASPVIAPRPARPVAAAPQVVPPAGTPFDSYRYREALKNISRVLSQHHDERTLLSEFLRLVRELLGVGKIAILTRHATGAANQFEIAASAGIAREVVEHLRLTLDAGIGGYLAGEAAILRRAQAALDYDAQMVREFELLGADVAVPMFDNDQLLGVLTFSNRITGEAFSNEDLELVYHLLTQLAQAVNNLHLLDRIAGQQRLFAEVLANVQSGVVVAGQGGRILSLNARARELLELGAEEFVGEDLRRLPSRAADVVFEALQTGREIRDREIELPRSQRPLSVSATRFAASVTTGDGAADNLVAIALIEDLTQVKLQRAQERELADKEFFTRLSSRMSHELKNSLVSIKIFAQLLPERHGEKEFREQFSTTVTNEINRVDVLVNNLTFFAQPLALVCDGLVLGELLDDCLASATREFARKKAVQIVHVGDKAADVAAGVPVITVKKNFSHKLARVEGDKLRLMQAFEHLLRNAVQSMPTGGRLSINTADAQPSDFPDGNMPECGAVRIEWQDTGEGIPLENLERVTEPFITTRNVGVGLGLTIVKKIIERHGGRLEIDSLLGRGTTVTTILPVKAQPHPDDELIAQISKKVGAADSTGGEGEADATDRLAKPPEREKRRRN